MNMTVDRDASVDSRQAVLHTAESRRSIRKFVQEPIPLEDLQEILRLVGLAPSAGNVQTWRFAVAHTPAAKAKLVDAMTDNNKRTVESAPASIVLYSDAAEFLDTVEEIMHPGLGAEEIALRSAGMRKRIGSMPPEKQAEWARSQSFIALGYLMLIARGFGYDTSPMGGYREDAIRTAFGLPDSARVTAVIAIGERAEDGFSHHRHETGRITSWH